MSDLRNLTFKAPHEFMAKSAAGGMPLGATKMDQLSRVSLEKKCASYSSRTKRAACTPES